MVLLPPKLRLLLLLKLKLPPLPPSKVSKKVSISGIGNGRKKSVVWGPFEKIKVEEVTKAICNCCQKSYCANNKSCGTSNLLAHLPNCPKNPNRVDLVKGKKP